MKCVCPSGGDRECPNDCTLAVWASLSVTDRKSQRKTVAEKLYNQGFTMETIATQLSVSHPTIVRDLREFVHDEQIKKSTKTATNPKGAGRPKGSGGNKKPRGETAKFAKAREIVRPRIEAEQPLKTGELEAEHRISKDTFERAALAEQARKEAFEEVKVDPATLSMTAQAKLELAIKQATKKLEIEIEHRVRAELWKWLQRQLDQYNENKRHYEIVLKARKGFMDKTAYNLIWSCLHADSRKSVSDERLNKAFHLWTSLEKIALNEKDSPTKPSDLPKTVEELMKRKAQYAAERAAQRAAKKGSANVERR